jgi:hypothetical protein
MYLQASEGCEMLRGSIRLIPDIGYSQAMPSKWKKY